jgi:hypothetical protein
MNEKVWAVYAGKTELQVPHHTTYQHSIECHGVLYYCTSVLQFILPPQMKQKKRDIHN